MYKLDAFARLLNGQEHLALVWSSCISVPLLNGIAISNKVCSFIDHKNQPAGGPLTQVLGQEQLTPVERLQMAPFWSTFCGTSNGAWQGMQAAFSPLTGQPPVLLTSCLACRLRDLSTCYSR